MTIQENNQKEDKDTVYALLARVDTEAWVVAISRNEKTLKKKLREEMEKLTEEMRENTEDDIEKFVIDEGTFGTVSSLRSTAELSIQEITIS